MMPKNCLWILQPLVSLLMAVLVMNVHKQNVKVTNGAFEENRETIFE